VFVNGRTREHQDLYLRRYQGKKRDMDERRATGATGFAILMLPINVGRY
jgi:hypothetical protein